MPFNYHVTISLGKNPYYWHDGLAPLPALLNNKL